jgi:hypothetical protein
MEYRPCIVQNIYKYIQNMYPPLVEETKEGIKEGKKANNNELYLCRNKTQEMLNNREYGERARKCHGVGLIDLSTMQVQV